MKSTKYNNLLIWQKSVEITHVLYFTIVLGSYLFHYTVLPMDCGSMTWVISLLSDTQRTFRIVALIAGLWIEPHLLSTYVYWTLFQRTNNTAWMFCSLRRRWEKICWVLSRLISHFIDLQSLGKAVQCNINVNTHNRLTGEVISHNHSPAIRATTQIFV